MTPEQIERKREYNRLRYAQNRGKIQAQTASYRASNPDKVREISRLYTEANREAIYAKNKQWRSANPDAVSRNNLKWRTKNAEVSRLRSQLWRTENPDRYVQNIQKWQRANRGRLLAYSRKRKALNRAPDWADLGAISFVYRVAQIAKTTWPEEGIHVDHALPLAGKKVSGLHVHNNLRIVTAKENLTKSNRFEPS